MNRVGLAGNAGTSEAATRWHLLDAGGITTREFAAALDRLVPLVCWQPQFRWVPFFRMTASAERLEDPPLDLHAFPLQHGYSRPAVARLSRFAARTAALIERHAGADIEAPLICTTPFYAPVAERWKGPVIYYLTDLAAAYEGFDAERVMALDRRMCARAALVCPNSRRLADYLAGQGCDRQKIAVLPNATRAASVQRIPAGPARELPPDLRDLHRPLAGVIGNLAGNLDWELIEEAIALAPRITWVFVGPLSMRIACRRQSAARDRVLKNRARTRFVGPKPYGLLHRYARAFDAGVMPYRGIEPTLSGSATRYYEHLAACRPMLATRGVDELTEKEPLLRLVESGAELAEALRRLERDGFRDGFEQARWAASRAETWDCRAQALLDAYEAAAGPAPEDAAHDLWAAVYRR